MTPRLPLLALVLSLAFIPSASADQSQLVAAAWPQQASDLQADPDVRFGTLPNGMRYAIRRNATPPGNASLRLRIDAGSLHEADDQQGLAHFIEHMVMNGTTNVPEGEFIRRLERHGLRFGPDTNATTEFGQTYYKLDLPRTDAATVDEALFLLREAAGEATFSASAINSERGIIQAEERTRSTPPLRALIDELGFQMPGQLLPRRIPIGTPEVIANAQRDRFLAFYRAYYRPERATLIAIGDFDVDQMERKIRTRFANWQGQGPAGRNPDFGTTGPRRTEARLRVEAGLPNRLSLAWVRPVDARPDNRANRTADLAEALAMAVLTRRLERIAATQTPSPFLASGALPTEYDHSSSIRQVIAIVQPGQWQRALTTIETEQRRLVQHGVTQAELTREIAQLRSALTAAAAGAATRPTPAIADAMVRAVNDDEVFTSPAEALRLFEAAAPAMTAERVNGAARAIYAGEPLVYMTSSTPIEGGDAALLAAYRTSSAVAVAAAEGHQAQAWPYTNFGAPGAVVERRELPPEIGGTMVRFANGVRLTVKQTSFADDQIAVSVRLGNGFGGVRPDQPNPATYLGAGFTAGGLGRMSFEDMQEALASRTYSVNFGASEDAWMLMGRTRPEDFATQMQVLTAYVADPGWRTTGFDRMKSFSGNIHDQLAATPGGVFNRDAAALLHNGERRWGIPTREEMAAASFDVIRGTMEPAMRGPIEVIVVGDISVDEAIRQVAATFGALPRRSEARVPPAVTRFPAGNAEPVRLTHGGRADQGLAYIAWPTTGVYTDLRQARALTALADVFQLRLIQKIREEQGASYSPASGHNPSRVFATYGTFFGRIEARPEMLAGFMRDAQAIAADLAARPIDADEMARAMRPRLETMQRQRNDNMWWLGELARIQTDPRVARSITSQMADYQSLTPADLQQTARRFLLPASAYKLVIMPQPGAAAAPAAGAAPAPGALSVPGLPPGAVLRPAPGSPALPPGAVLRPAPGNAPRPSPAPTPTP